MADLEQYYQDLLAGRRTRFGDKALLGLLRLASLPYASVMRLRALCYRLGILPAHRLPRPVISVGNIALGGTGKTPTVAWVASYLMARGRKVCVLSRGYGGSEEGAIRIVSDGKGLQLSPEQAGDEPCQLAGMLPGLMVVIGADRYRAGLHAIEQLDPDAFIMDDGFQHLKLERDLNILLLDAANPFAAKREDPSAVRETPCTARETSCTARETSCTACETSCTACETSCTACETSSAVRETPSAVRETSCTVRETSSAVRETPSVAREPSCAARESSSLVGEQFGCGLTLPGGFLREPPTAAARADIVLCTRTRGNARVVPVPGKPTCWTKHKLSGIVPLVDGAQSGFATVQGARVMAFSGIANPVSFFDGLEEIGVRPVTTLSFPDHTRYDEPEIAAILRLKTASRSTVLLTTQKDAVKLLPHAEKLSGCYAVVLELEFDDARPLEQALDKLMSGEFV